MNDSDVTRLGHSRYRVVAVLIDQTSVPLQDERDMRPRYWALSRMMSALSGCFMQGAQQRMRLDQASLARRPRQRDTFLNLFYARHSLNSVSDHQLELPLSLLVG